MAATFLHAADDSLAALRQRLPERGRVSESAIRFLGQQPR